MKRYFSAALLVAFAFAFASAQETTNGGNSIKVLIRNEETEKAVIGATVSVKGAEITATTDADGKAELIGVPNGEQTVEVFSAGYETRELKFTFPLVDRTEKIIAIK